MPPRKGRRRAAPAGRQLPPLPRPGTTKAKRGCVLWAPQPSPGVARMTTCRLTISTALLAGFLALGLAGPFPAATRAAGESAGVSSGGLTAVLDSVKADKLRADLEFIASDEMEGRDTP